MEIRVDSKITVENPPDKLNLLLRESFSFPNPAYQEARKHDRSTRGIPRILNIYSVSPSGNGLILPRGAARRIISMSREMCGPVPIFDARIDGEPHDFSFSGELREYQESAVAGILERDFGVLEAGTGAGKTVMALAIIARRQCPTLVLVHTRELLLQWGERIRTFLGIEPGVIGGGVKKIELVTVGIVNSVEKLTTIDLERFSHLVVDECHRVPSRTFTGIVERFGGKYSLGLSATPFRRDGMDRLIGWYLGENVVRISPGYLRDSGAILRPVVKSRNTKFFYRFDDDYSKMISALCADPGRNRIIADDIRNASSDKKMTLVVSDRVEHLNALADIAGVPFEILTGKTKKRDRERIVSNLDSGKIKTLFSTISLIGEGFDAPGLDSLIIATPIKFRGRFMQVCGRILRPLDGKTATIYDYADSNCPVLMASWKSRQREINEMNKGE